MKTLYAFLYQINISNSNPNLSYFVFLMSPNVFHLQIKIVYIFRSVTVKIQIILSMSFENPWVWRRTNENTVVILHQE